jgi:alpha-L-rhamnosidase
MHCFGSMDSVSSPTYFCAKEDMKCSVRSNSFLAINWHRGFARLATISLALSTVPSVTAVAQMGNPAVGPTRIANENLDPTRQRGVLTLEPSIHQPLPEQYIWTKADAVPNDAIAAAGWVAESSASLKPHYFRRVFEVSNSPAEATLYVAGPRSAVIYLNGQRVGSYQLNLDFPMGIRVYACDVGGVLKTGKNVLAIEAIRGPQIGSGADSRLSIQQTQGEVLAVKIVPAARGINTTPLLISDQQWKASLHATSGWQSESYDDTNWPAADILGGIESSIEFFQWNSDAGMYAWPGYDGISSFLAQYHFRAAKVSREYDALGKMENSEALTSDSSAGEEFRVELPKETVREADAPQIMLDFGREVAGRIELESTSNQPSDITVQYGESETEALRDPYLGVDPVHIASHGTAYGPKSAFRYAVIRFTGGKEMRFKFIGLDGIAYPVHYQGYFSSSDSELNQMWAIGAYTAHLCMQDDIWDAPKRDRGRWMGDLDVSGRTIEDAFGDGPLMDETLDRLIGSAPVRKDVNGIPGYSAFWVIGETEYYRHMGSMQQLESLHTRLVQLLNYMQTEMNRKALYTNEHNAWIFVDWSPELNGDDAESRRATQMEFYAAFRDGAWLLQQLHDTANAAKFEEEADAIKTTAQQHLLDPSGSFGPRWQTNAYAVLSGIANPSQYDAIWRGALSSVGREKYNALIITPYYNYYVVSAMAQMGHRQEALNWIREYWGGMTREGATSFWEGYDPSWYTGDDFHASLQADNMSGYRVSLAHGWSSGVTPWLMEQVLGIHATGPGFSTVDIRPDLIDLQWAKGAEPTPRGMLTVDIRKKTGEYVTVIDLPQDTTASVSVPVSSPGAQVMVNGKTESTTSAENGTRAVVTLHSAGRYEISSR